MKSICVALFGTVYAAMKDQYIQIYNEMFLLMLLTTNSLWVKVNCFSISNCPNLFYTILGNIGKCVVIIVNTMNEV